MRVVVILIAKKTMESPKVCGASLAERRIGVVVRRGWRVGSLERGVVHLRKQNKTTRSVCVRHQALASTRTGGCRWRVVLNMGTRWTK